MSVLDRARGEARRGCRITRDEGRAIVEALDVAEGALRKTTLAFAEEHRAALVRALTAQAWAVACSLTVEAPWHGDDDEDSWYLIHDDNEQARLADLPSPSQLADDLLGIPPR